MIKGLRPIKADFKNNILGILSIFLKIGGNKNQEDAISSKLYFKDIHNDTLSFGTYLAPIGYRVVKVK